MRCRECPYSLVCHAGLLDGTDGGAVTLCPTCKRITLLKHDGAYLAFKCEQRPWTIEYQVDWKELRRKAKGSSHSVVMQFPVPDPGPGLINDLVIRECAACIPGTVERNYNVNLKPVDLDEELAANEEEHVNPLALRCRIPQRKVR